MARFSASVLLLLSLLISSSQAIALISRYFSFYGYDDKGPLGYVFSGPADDPSLIRLFHLNNWHTWDHYFTANPVEKDSLLLNSETNGWQDERTDNPAWKGMWVYGDAGPAKDRVPLYHMYSKSENQHLWTIDATEVESLKKTGWVAWGITCYFPNPAGQPTGTAEMVHRYTFERPQVSQ